MPSTPNAPLYQKITDDIHQRLQAGEFGPGDRMYSIEECRQHYSVSATTAIRAIDELKQLGVVESIKGKGSFFTGIPTADSDPADDLPLRRLAVLSHKRGFFTDGFQAAICMGIEQTAHDHHLTLRLEHIPFHDATGFHTLPYEPAADEGLIMMGPCPNLATMGLLAGHRNRSVLVDGIYPNLQSVATDNLGGMAALVDYLREQGHRRLLLGIRFPRSPNSVNDNERRAAFEFLTRQHGLHGEVMPADDLAVIVRRVQAADGPTAVMFTQDNGAQAFCEAAIDAGLHVPRDVSVTGFDGFLLDHDEQTAALTTMIVDREGLGRAAVEALLAPPAETADLVAWRRVPATFRQGATVTSPTTNRRT